MPNLAATDGFLGQEDLELVGSVVLERLTQRLGAQDARAQPVAVWNAGRDGESLQGP
jgi:hypothetical protein